MAGLVLVTPPAVEPVDPQDQLAFMRVDGTSEIQIAGALTTAARRYVEDTMNRALITQTWDLYLDRFPAVIQIPRPPLQSVTSITYVDTSEVSTVLSSSLYRVDTASEPGRITPAWGETWPSTLDVTNAVIVRFVAGYGATAGNVPDGIRAAIKMLAAHWFENREAVVLGSSFTPQSVPFAVESLFWQYRVMEFA